MGSDPFIGQLTGFAGNFAPRSWAFCDGQLLAISQNDALFSLLGTIYGGDGRTSFGLPDLRGRIPIHQGTGPGLSHYALGQKSGVETVTLSAAQMPSHNHIHHAVDKDGNTSPNNAMLDNTVTFAAGAPTIPMNNAVIGSTGGSQSHTNMPPFLCTNWIIALLGTYPSRT